MPLREKNILVIDDAPSIRTFVRIALQAKGVRFHEAATAEEGLRLSHSVSPDLIVLDLGLPDKDGLEILPEIRELANGRKLPKIIILSVRKEQSIKRQAALLGADDYLTKPFMMEDLIETIEKHFTN